MNGNEKLVLEDLARHVHSKAMFCNHEDEEKFLRMVFWLLPESEVLMRYENTLFELAGR